MHRSWVPSIAWVGGGGEEDEDKTKIPTNKANAFLGSVFVWSLPVSFMWPNMG
jgi:hypothetical protein